MFNNGAFLRMHHYFMNMKFLSYILLNLWYCFIKKNDYICKNKIILHEI